MDILFLTATQEAGSASLIVPVIYIVAIGIIAFFVWRGIHHHNKLKKSIE